MKYLCFLFFLWGCYLPKTAEKQISKAQKHYPELVAKKASELYPVNTDSVEFIKWKLQVDTLVNLIEYDRFIHDTLRINTQCGENFKKRYDFQKWLNQELKKKIQEVKPIVIKDSAETFRLRSEVNRLQSLNDRIRNKCSIISWILVSFFILFLLYLIAYILKKR